MNRTIVITNMWCIVNMFQLLLQCGRMIDLGHRKPQLALAGYVGGNRYREWGVGWVNREGS